MKPVYSGTNERFHYWQIPLYSVSFYVQCWLFPCFWVSFSFSLSFWLLCRAVCVCILLNCVPRCIKFKYMTELNSPEETQQRVACFMCDRVFTTKFASGYVCIGERMYAFIHTYCFDRRIWLAKDVRRLKIFVWPTARCTTNLKGKFNKKNVLFSMRWERERARMCV